MFSILDLIPKDVVEKLKTLEVEELPRYVKYIKEVIKEKVSTILHYKDYNLKTLSKISEFPTQVGLFWVGQLDSKMKLQQNRNDPLVIYSVWNKDIFLFPTIVFDSQESLEKWLDEVRKDDYPFLYRDKKVYYYENFLPLGNDTYKSISIFYQKLYPLM